MMSCGHSAEFLLTAVLDIVHPDDVRHVLEAFESAAASADAHAAVPVRSGGRRAWQPTRVLVNDVPEQDGFGFTLAPLDDDLPLVAPDRASELERRLPARLEVAAPGSRADRPPRHKSARPQARNRERN
jgi:hypothetical protein